MTPEAREKLDAYRPQIPKREWEKVGPLVRSLMERAEPAAAQVQRTGAAVVRYVRWGQEKGLGLDPADFLSERVVEWFLDDADINTQSTVDSYASVLQRVLNGPAPTRTPRSERQPLLCPYTAAEVEALLSLVPVQPTPQRRVRLESMIRLGVGVGARPEEVRYVKPEDVFEAHGEVTVRLGAPDEPGREVPALRAHGRRLVELAAEAEELEMSYLVIGNGSPRNKNGLVRLADKVNGKVDAPGLSTWRLRATWLVTLLSAHLPYDVITTIGGKGTGARLSELLEYVEPLDTETMARMVAGAGGEQR